MRGLATIEDNENKIVEFLHESLISHRMFYRKWSEITNQTATVKSGYLSQHLASLITGVKGSYTGARGDDLLDGTEVKACTRIDQLDTCGNPECRSPVTRYMLLCPVCQTDKILRKNDSKWLFSPRSLEDVGILTSIVPRILLILFDYPLFAQQNFEVIDIKAYEIYPSDPRQIRFKEIIENYYNNIYLVNKQLKPNKTPAPKNFWPESYQFYLCNPIQTLHARTENNEVKILAYVPPNENREFIEPVAMPVRLLKPYEMSLVNLAGKEYLDSKERLLLPLRDDSTFEVATLHTRRSFNT
jgi:hypothetical protein